MAAAMPDDVLPVAPEEAQAFQAFVIDGVTKQLQKDGKADRLPEFVAAAGAYGKGALEADAFLATLADLFGAARALKLAPTLARLVKHEGRRRALLAAARGDVAVEVLGAASPNGAAAAEPSAPDPSTEEAATALRRNRGRAGSFYAPAEEPTPEPPTPEPSPPASPAPAPTEAPPTEPPAPAAPEPAPTEEPPTEPAADSSEPEPALEPAQASKSSKKKARKKKKKAAVTEPAPTAEEPAVPDEPSTPTATVPADATLFTPRPSTPDPSVPADPTLFTPVPDEAPVAFADESRKLIAELAASEPKPAAAEAPQVPPAVEATTEPAEESKAESAAAGEAEWEAQLAALEAEKWAERAAEEAAAAPLVVPPELKYVPASEQSAEARRTVAAFAAAETWQMSVGEGDRVEALKDHDDGWTECRSADGATGAVPTTYLVKLEEEPAPAKASTRVSLATGAEAAELQRSAVRAVRARLDELGRSDRLPELVQGTRRYAAGDLTASGMRSALADLLSSDEESRTVCRTLAQLVVDDQKRAALAAAAEAPAEPANEDFFAAIARDTAELRSQKSLEEDRLQQDLEDRRASTQSAAEDEREILLARSHGVGVSPDVVSKLQRLSEDEELAKRLQREEERRKSNTYADVSRQRTDAALAERLQRTSPQQPAPPPSFWGSLFGNDEKAAPPPRSPLTDKRVQEDADAAFARRLQAEEHARAARRRAPPVYDGPSVAQAPVLYDQYGRPSQAPYRQPPVDEYGRPGMASYASQPPQGPPVDEYGRPVMQTQRAPSYAPPPRQDYRPQERAYVPPAPPPRQAPYAHSMRGSLGSAPYSRPPPAPAPPPAPPPPPPPPVVDEMDDLFSCGACGTQMQVRGAEAGAQFTCPDCGAVNEV